MRIGCIGGGPAGLYFSILMKKAFPQASIRVVERNRPDDTFGWGVVFSAETLGNLREADEESYAAITNAFAYWDDIETWYRGECIVSTGHGFCGMSRRGLLLILQERAQQLGVDLCFETEVDSVDAFDDADLVVAADGVNSKIRGALSDVFRPTIEWGRCRFAWLGTTLPLRAFTFIFKENTDGLFIVHAYPFEKGTSTFIVETHEDTWRRAGLDRASEEETVAYCEALFADELKGHRLLTNRSIWRSFPTVRCERWAAGNVVLLGDAAHTAHFSVGSGTKLAMEDAIALVDAFRAHGLDEIPRVLEAYEESRRVPVAKIQKTAGTSQRWFENARRYMGQHPLCFTFNLLTRSKAITWDNLSLRDPAFVEQVRTWWGETHGGARNPDGQYAPPIFAPFRLRALELSNRVVVSPMCQYSATDGVVGDWHFVHYASRAIGGAGLVLTEETNVSPEGRITPGCAGIWNDVQTEAWKRIVDFVHQQTPAKIGMQIGHAGRKGSCSRPWEGDRPLPPEEAWETLGPSPIPFDEGWPAPREMTREDMDRIRDAFVAAARNALDAGFDLLELHAAHGYLLSSFLTPVANQRTDAYGGSLENRMRFPLEVFDAVRSAWPEDRPLIVRLTVEDWLGDEGFTLDEAVEVCRALKARGCDLIDVSSGGNSPRSQPVYGRMYQVPFAERIRQDVGIPVCAVGAILGADHANTVLAAERADLVAMARPHLRDPYLTLRASQHYGYESQWWPVQYLAAKRPPPPK
ncbi:MAG: bifunctional salicylyl-CoA 5-hydroxylase/oxidoreductase [Deltaproteobacteria bacterium]|nr:MAG: bifunctional salicylyl-CoA 5-hydroxylase/oxidoreductase [Deltaproteobacteria bacterium]